MSKLKTKTFVLFIVECKHGSKWRAYNKRTTLKQAKDALKFYTARTEKFRIVKSVTKSTNERTVVL